MEFFHNTQFAIPMVQIMFLLVLSTGALLLGRIKLALLMNYLFTLYWGYISRAELFSSLENLDLYTSLYFGFGLVIVLCATVGFMAHRH